MKKQFIFYITMFMIALMFSCNNVIAKTICYYKQSYPSSGNSTLQMHVNSNSQSIYIDSEKLKINYTGKIKLDDCPSSLWLIENDNESNTWDVYSNVEEFNKIHKENSSYKQFTYYDFMKTNEDGYNNYEGSLLSCGNGLIDKIPHMIPRVVSSIYLIIQIAVPVVLVVMGMLDLIKGIISTKEDEIKKGQKTFIKRLIAAALIFFVFVIVKLVISLVADASSNGILECAKCFLEKKCQ